MAKFRNFTPHPISLSDGREFPSEGVSRVSSEHTAFDADGICDVVYGDITGLPEPEDGTKFIVSFLLLDAAKAQGRTDCVAPATGHPDTVRKEQGHIANVPGFVR